MRDGWGGFGAVVWEKNKKGRYAMGYRIECLIEGRKKLPQVGFRPALCPQGEDGFHTDEPFTQSDIEIGEVCGWHMGDIFHDCMDEPNFMHNKMTSQDTCARFARALRIHGLKIVDDPGFAQSRDCDSWND